MVPVREREAALGLAGLPVSIAVVFGQKKGRAPTTRSPNPTWKPLQDDQLLA
jgi:hypothetical protein